MIEKFAYSVCDKKIAIVGLGGLGGYLASFLARLNPKALLLIDGDRFCSSNMNRQLFCSDLTIGLYKVEAAKDAISHYTNAKILTFNDYLSDDNSSILEGYDVIMDATDNILARKILINVCNLYKIPVIHGAINGLFGQVAVIRPDNDIFSKLNTSGETLPTSATLSFVPANIATHQVNEMLKLFASGNPLESDQLLIIDLINNDTRIIRL